MSLSSGDSSSDVPLLVVSFHDSFSACCAINPSRYQVQSHRFFPNLFAVVASVTSFVVGQGQRERESDGSAQEKEGARGRWWKDGGLISSSWEGASGLRNFSREL